jgi:hypothetical protein
MAYFLAHRLQTDYITFSTGDVKTLFHSVYSPCVDLQYSPP